MTLDQRGLIVPCAACGARNRRPYGAIGRAMRCGRCQTALPLPRQPVAVPDTASFDALLAQASVPVLVDFWAAWCGPCRMVAPELEKVAERQAGHALVVKVDTDAHPDLGQRYRIQSIPTLMVVRNGRVAARVSGVRPAEAIEALLTAPDETAHG